MEVVFRCVLELVLDLSAPGPALAGPTEAAVLGVAFLEMDLAGAFLGELFLEGASDDGVDWPLPLRALAAVLAEAGFLVPFVLVVTGFVLLDALDLLLDPLRLVLLAGTLPVVFCACFFFWTADFTFDFGIENWLIYHTISRRTRPRKIAVKYG